MRGTGDIKEGSTILCCLAKSKLQLRDSNVGKESPVVAARVPTRGYLELRAGGNEVLDCFGDLYLPRPLVLVPIDPRLCNRLVFSQELELARLEPQRGI